MSFLNKLSKKEKLGLFIAAAFVFFSILDRAIISPISRSIREMDDKMKIDEKRLKEKLRYLNQKDEINREYQKYANVAQKKQSEEEEIAGMLSEIENLSKKSSVYLTDIKPRPSRQTDFYKEYIVEVEAESGMESLVDFLHQLSSSPQLLRAEKLRIGLKDKNSSAVKASLLITKAHVP
jgi:Tfp pilus assembly protein PilO